MPPDGACDTPECTEGDHPDLAGCKAWWTPALSECLALCLERDKKLGHGLVLEQRDSYLHKTLWSNIASLLGLVST